MFKRIVMQLFCWIILTPVLTYYKMIGRDITPLKKQLIKIIDDY
tara:strand:- start:381 stop:512 length:132 start_codon:yes stop_codon:yes gene_type:complete